MSSNPEGTWQTSLTGSVVTQHVWQRHGMCGSDEFGSCRTSYFVVLVSVSEGHITHWVHSLLFNMTDSSCVFQQELLTQHSVSRKQNDFLFLKPVILEFFSPSLLFYFHYFLLDLITLKMQCLHFMWLNVSTSRRCDDVWFKAALRLRRLS